jgi:predicted transcriptional regulator
MTEEVVTVDVGATVREAVDVLNEKNCNSLVVLQNGRPVGIITERDILKRVIPTCEDPDKIKVDNIMSVPLVVGKPRMELSEAAEIMLDKKIKNLPVVYREKLVGIVTLSDIIRSPDSMEWFKNLPDSEISSGMKKVISTYFDLERFGKKCPLMMEQGYPKKCRKAECMWWIEEDCAVVILSKQINNGRATEIIRNF